MIKNLLHKKIVWIGGAIVVVFVLWWFLGRKSGTQIQYQTAAAEKGITSSEAIVTSTGRLGVSRRSDDRLAIIGGYSNDPSHVTNTFRRLQGVGEGYPNRFSRVYMRGVVGPDVMEHVRSNGLGSHLEVALPLAEYTGQDDWFIHLAKNGEGRQSTIVSLSTLEEIAARFSPSVSPRERVATKIEGGYSFTDHINPSQIGEIQEMWGDTFGWDTQQVENFQEMLLAQQYLPPSLRTTWITIAQAENGKVAGLAMAEKSTMSGVSGRPFDVIESTEWKVDPEHRGQQLMPAILSVLNAKVIGDQQEGQVPFLYAETNIATRAYMSGHSAGFRMPSTQDAPQILVQNVAVGDGIENQDAFRDFVFMAIPPDIIRADYPSGQITAIKELAGIK